MTETLYEKLSKERKRLQAEGNLPEWFTTGGWQMFKSKYLYEAKTPKEQYQRIARTAAKHIEGHYPDWWVEQGYTTWEDAFFDILWKGWLSPSTPVLSNTGTSRGLPVSCSGSVVGDSVYDFYDALKEAALLSKHGFGTSGYFGGIRPRGTPISSGGVASGVMPVIEDFFTMASKVSQGASRRGAFAAYIEIDHPDFQEVVDYVKATPDDANIGWIVTDAFIKRLQNGDEEANTRWKTALELKMLTGKGYFCKIDEVNRHRPAMYRDKGLYVKSSNLCDEIALFADVEHTFTCVLSSMNVAKADVWMGTKAVFIATVFLDCIAEEFIQLAKQIEGLEKAVRFTEKGRALGLGQCGLHTYFQEHMMPFDGFEAHMFNTKVSKHIGLESADASRWMAKVLGEPEWCKGYGMRNTHRTAIAPTKTTALIMGGISEGANPDPAMTYTQATPAGEIDRVNPTLLKIMKERGVNTKKHIQQIVDDFGSVRNVDWLTDEEKLVFRTAFEIPQEAILRLASTRQPHVCQGQSLNLFFSGDEEEEYIASIHKQAMLDEDILGLYYVYSKRGVHASKGECAACM